MVFYGFESFDKDVDSLIEKLGDYQPDILLAVARGGMTLGHFMAVRMGIRTLLSMNSVHYDETQKLQKVNLSHIPDLGSGKKVLILDDIVDSGESMVEILAMLKAKYPKNSYQVATIFYKHSASIQPDFSCHEAKEWIEFFWEVRPKR